MEIEKALFQGKHVADSIKTFRELRVWQEAMDACMDVFHVSKAFPKEERYSLTDQIRRSSRSVASNLAEAFKKRRYQAAFVSKLSDCEAEAAETQTWAEIALRCEYIDQQTAKRWDDAYETIQGRIGKMLNNPEAWVRNSASVRNKSSKD